RAVPHVLLDRVLGAHEQDLLCRFLERLRRPVRRRKYRQGYVVPLRAAAGGHAADHAARRQEGVGGVPSASRQGALLSPPWVRGRGAESKRPIKNRELEGRVEQPVNEGPRRARRKLHRAQGIDDDVTHEQGRQVQLGRTGIWWQLGLGSAMAAMQ